LEPLTQILVGLAIAFGLWQCVEAVLLVRVSRKSEWHDNPSLVHVDGKQATVLRDFEDTGADGWHHGLVSLRGETWRARCRADAGHRPYQGSVVRVIQADGLTLEVCGDVDG
jgi:membrane protein implicated in regulation of membrane protease activity